MSRAVATNWNRCRRALAAAGLGVSLCAAGCAGATRAPAPTPTFTPAPLPAGVATPPRSAHPVVSPDCLRGLSSYRFSGTFSLRPSDSGATPGQEAGAGLAGSLANLLRNVSFQGSARAPDRYKATVNFGGNGVQSLQIVRIGPQTYSRFGNGAWQQGDQLQDLGGIAELDPQTLCQTALESLDSGNQSPAHETVNGVPALRYQLSGAQLFGTPSGAEADATPAPGAGVASEHATVWTAQKGGYPVRFAIDGPTDAGQVSLLVNVTDVNGKDIQISAPSTATPQMGR